VDQPRGVRGREPAAGVHERPQHFAPRPLRGAQPALQGLAIDVLEREEHVVLDRPDVVHRDHVPVGQARHRARLLQQPLAEARAVHPGDDELERDAAVKVGIVGLVHDAHATLADLVDDEVAPEHRPAGQGWSRSRLARDRRGLHRIYGDHTPYGGICDGRIHDGAICDGGTRDGGICDGRIRDGRRRKLRRLIRGVVHRGR
jgi:hypothetical protein